MGAILSYLGYQSQQRPCPPSREHVSQQLHHGSLGGPTLILGNGDAASASIIDLYTRLGALERDLQVTRAENINKEAVIQYLLQSNLSNARVKEITENLKDQLLALKTTADRTNEESEAIKDRLSKAEDNIFALSTSSVPNSKPHSASTSFSSRSNSLPKSESVAEDLIDLVDYSHESDSAKLMEEDTTLLDESHEDDSDIEGEFEDTTPDQSLQQSSDSEFEGASYIVHFVDSDEDTKPQDAVKVSTKVRVPRDSSDPFTHTQQQSEPSVLHKESEHSSTDDTSSPSGPNSTVTSFTSASSGVSPLNDVNAKVLDETFSQLKALDSEDGSLEKSVAIISTLARNLSSFGINHQTEPSQPSAEAATEAQDLQTSVGDNIMKPRWSPERIFDSSQDRETAISINKRCAQAGAGDVPYPDLFRHGIRYDPKTYEQDVYRTVAISRLPPSVTMMGLLEKVRGGMLVDAKLLDTAKITGSNTALVTFLRERSAMAYEEHAKKYPIAFSNVVARVAVVRTPTWPVPANLRRGIENSGNTRCFEVHNVPRHIILRTVRQELTASPVMKSDNLECMRLGADGVLGLRFSSIRAAGYSSALFSQTLHYRGCTVHSLPDPCAQPLETLLEQRADTPKVVEEETPGPSNPSEAKATTHEQNGRLAKVKWESDPELCRGRGFATGS